MLLGEPGSGVSAAHSALLAGLQVPILTVEALLCRAPAQLSEESGLSVRTVHTLRRRAALAAAAASETLTWFSGGGIGAETAQRRASWTSVEEGGGGITATSSGSSRTSKSKQGKRRKRWTLSAQELCARCVQRGGFLTTGCARLDAVLGGSGLCTGYVTEFVARSGGGKTLCVMGIAATTALRGHGVVIVDSCNAVTPEAIYEKMLTRARNWQLLEHQQQQQQQQHMAAEAREEEREREVLAQVEAAMMRVTIVRVMDVEDLLDVVTSVAEHQQLPQECSQGLAAGAATSTPPPPPEQKRQEHADHDHSAHRDDNATDDAGYDTDFTDYGADDSAGAPQSAREQTAAAVRHCRLFIVDSMVPFLMPVLLRQSQDSSLPGWHAIQQVSLLLHHLAQTRFMSVVVTNLLLDSGSGSSGGGGGGGGGNSQWRWPGNPPVGTRPALGAKWGHVADIRVALAAGDEDGIPPRPPAGQAPPRDPSATYITVRATKHCFRAISQTPTEVKIDEGGVSDP